MTTPFNLPSLDSAYNFPVLQQPQQFHQVVEAAIVSNTFANPNSFINQQQSVQAELAYLYNNSNCHTNNCSSTQPQQQSPSIQHAFLYNPTAYPSPPLDASFPSPPRMTSNDSGDHHNNTDSTQNFHNGSIITDLTSPPSFNPSEQKPTPSSHSISTVTEGYQAAPPYPTSQYPHSHPHPHPPPPQTGMQMDRRTSITLVPIHHQTKIEPGTSEGSESWRISAETTNAPYPFGHYKPPKSYDDRALDPSFFTDPSMKMPSGPSTAQPPMGYYSTGPPVSYDRNGIPHPVNFSNPMQPTPQDYSMTMMQNQNGNGVRNVPQYHTANSNRPPPVPAPQTMMTTFSSKTVSSTPKRYKCNICQKRFTRPSSLQTHTYSHTGEKPFKCPVEGCGRHFSVVSNLRRHQKIHSKQ
ncbi:hypothetical protein Glove_227g129 [Diversispora epigaea]|uniref:C2H2-type domain-containing protein n=1 Tax=Diversispora epigaea TaxID=1348612 RepID=A0A397IKB3_9GLOM|nr:hypothetical protein Glove_227g129 [Diversispora epigaea]